MMLQVQYMQPILTTRTHTTLRFVFAYEHFIIRQHDQLFHFVPMEAKEMIINLHDMQIQNMTDIFVFCNDTQMIRLPLFQLMLISNIQQYLHVIIEKSKATPKHHQRKINVDALLNELEAENTNRLIDYALDTHNKTLFQQLVNKTQ